MKNWERHRINPIDWMQRRGWPVEHISYDPKMRRGDYSIIRQSAHDGTVVFTEELIQKALVHLAMKASFQKSRETEFMASRESVRYIVGPLRMATVVGMVNLPVGNYPGQRERVRIPVRMMIAKAD